MRDEKNIKTKKMKNTGKNRNSKSAADFKIKEFRFYWIFEGNGEFTQKHKEIDYRRFIENNYENRSNQKF